MTELQTPLEGLRLLDLGRYQAGPRCALMFARMGAEVIKIESLGGDESRRNGPRVRGQSAYWVQYNSGKKSLAINLRTDEGKEVLRDLVKESDFFLQNFRPGTIDIMGFGYEELKKLNPRIIMINVSAYGQYGPYKERVGFDPIGQAMGGLMSLTGFEGDPPIRTFFPLIDRITSLHATIGALAALREREFSGMGQELEVCLADTGYTTNEIPISAYLGDGYEQPREGNGRGTGGTYKTADGWMIIAATNENMWGRLCEAVERPEWLEDERFATRELRSQNADALEEGSVGVVRGQGDAEGRRPPCRSRRAMLAGQHHRTGGAGPPPDRARGHDGDSRPGGRHDVGDRKVHQVRQDSDGRGLDASCG